MTNKSRRNILEIFLQTKRTIVQKIGFDSLCNSENIQWPDAQYEIAGSNTVW